MALGKSDYTFFTFFFVFSFFTLLVCVALPLIGAGLPFKEGAWQVRLHIFHFFWVFSFFTLLLCVALPLYAGVGLPFWNAFWMS